MEDKVARDAQDAEDAEAKAQDKELEEEMRDMSNAHEPLGGSTVLCVRCNKVAVLNENQLAVNLRCSKSHRSHSSQPTSDDSLTRPVNHTSFDIILRPFKP